MAVTCEADRPGSWRDLARRVVPLWLGIAAIYLITRWNHVVSLRQVDPDDTLRLVQVRDLIAGQGWFDLHQYRANPPDGVVMHWSRLVDLPLWLTEMVLSPLIGAPAAEKAAAALVPLAVLGLILLALGRVAQRLLGGRVTGYAVVLTGCTFPVVTQVLPTRVDHHGWQIAAVAVALAGFVTPDPRRSGWIAGAALALGMAISFELLPVAVLFGGVLALRWIIDPASGARFLHFAWALALTSLAAFALTRGPDLTNYCDAVSPVYLLALLTVAAGTALLARFAGPARWRIAAGLAVVAAAAGGLILFVAPECRSGPFAMLDPFLKAVWHNNVLEGLPVWKLPVPAMVQWTVPSLVGLFAAFRLHAQARGDARRLWLDYALLIAACFALGTVVLRSMAFCAVIAVVPLAWQVQTLVGELEKLRGAWPKLRHAVLLLGAIMPALPVYAVQLGAGVKASSLGASTSAEAEGDMDRDMPLAAAALSALPPARVLAPLDEGPLLLLHTPHSVVATGHHRGAPAMHDVMTAFIVDPPVARHIMARHGVSYVVLYPRTNEVAYYRSLSPNGFATRLSKGQAPDWMVPVPMPRESGLLVWKVQASAGR